MREEKCSGTCFILWILHAVATCVKQRTSMLTMDVWALALGEFSLLLLLFFLFDISELNGRGVE